MEALAETTTQSTRPVETSVAKGRRIMIFTAGTRGDVQPFAALGSALEQAGFVVCVATNANHVKFIRQFGLEAVSTGPDLEKIFADNPAIRTCLESGDIQKMLKEFEPILIRDFPQDFADKIRAVDTWKPDVILATPVEGPEVAAIAGARGIPSILTSLQVILPSRDQPTMLGEPRCFPRRILGTVLQYLLWRNQRDTKNAVILEQLPAATPFVAASLRQHMLNVFHPIVPMMVGFSPSLYSLKTDWTADVKSRIKFTGFWVVSRDEQVAHMGRQDANFGGEDSAGLVAFLAQGPPPVYMGWGSMVAVSGRHMACLAVRSLMKANLRGIILGGWAKLELSSLEGQQDTEEMLGYARENLLFVQSAPHEWLFPQCSAIVHHGGAGTTAAALRSGVPSVVTPFSFDQFDNAQLISNHGVGVAMRQFAKVTVADLAAALTRCTTNANLIATAHLLGEKLRSEDGLRNAVKVVDDFIVQEVDSGKWRLRSDRRAKQMRLLQARQSPGCLAWVGRLCCSWAPNDYSVKLPEDHADKRGNFSERNVGGAPTLLTRILSGDAAKSKC